jgi:hypothetical protein
MDVSVSGFRAAHADRDLSVGDHVGFSHPDRAGEAIVVWIRISQGTIESGFRILRTSA